jgi:hypothetical protein
VPLPFVFDYQGSKPLEITLLGRNAAFSQRKTELEGELGQKILMFEDLFGLDSSVLGKKSQTSPCCFGF